MRIIIAGAGTVGENISHYLSREGHDVVVVDKVRAKLAGVEDELDVQTIQGDACDPEMLKKLEIDRAAVLLAVTERDETNLVIAFAAKRMGCKQVVARVRSRYYYDTENAQFRKGLGIDDLVSPEILTAYQLARFVASPMALVQVSMAEGRVLLRTVRMSPESEFAGRLLKDVKIPEGALIAGLRRKNDVMIAHGDTRLEPEDRITFIGLPEALDALTPRFNLRKAGEGVTTVAIAGAGETGLFLARHLEERGHRVILLEQDRERAERAGEVLRRTRVLHADATDVYTLQEERIGKLDYFIAAMGDDEANIMSSLLARELGIEKTACVIERPDYARIVEKIGIDVAISPRLVVANRVLAMVKRGRIRSVTLLEEGELEINEFQALSKSRIVGHPLRDIEMPKGVLIGAVVQSGGEVRIPRGDDIIKPGAIVIGIAKTDFAGKLDDLFAAPRDEKE